jgi:nucleoside-diphosphate-sugar epimerase
MVLNVATGSRISLNQLFRELRALTGSDVEPAYGPNRAGDVRDSQAEISRAQELLGYRPLVSFRDGLRQTVDWYRNQHEPS